MSGATAASTPSPFDSPGPGLSMTIARDLTKPAIRLSLFLVGFGVYTSAFGASYPNRPITLVVPFPLGGPAGVVANIVAPALGARLEQKVVIENRSGADGIIGSEAVSAAPPDGYTLLLTTNSHVIHPGTYASLP